MILGPSDNGKSIPLRYINGLEEIQGSEVKLNGAIINRFGDSTLPAVRQELDMVFQSCGLFPHMNILGNITLAPTKM